MFPLFAVVLTIDHAINSVIAQIRMKLLNVRVQFRRLQALVLPEQIQDGFRENGIRRFAC